MTEHWDCGSGHHCIEADSSWCNCGLHPREWFEELDDTNEIQTQALGKTSQDADTQTNRGL